MCLDNPFYSWFKQKKWLFRFFYAHVLMYLPFNVNCCYSLCYSTGDVPLLNCTAIVNTSNESLNDKNPVSDSIHQLAGPELRDELLKLKGNAVRMCGRDGIWFLLKVWLFLLNLKAEGKCQMTSSTACRTIFNVITNLFSVWLSQSLLWLWRNFGPPFFTTLLCFIKVCRSLFMHSFVQDPPPHFNQFLTLSGSFVFLSLFRFFL